VCWCRLKISKRSRVLLLQSINRVNWIILARNARDHSLGNLALELNFVLATLLALSGLKSTLVTTEKYKPTK
jgi:hypothetical protein